MVDVDLCSFAGIKRECFTENSAFFTVSFKEGSVLPATHPLSSTYNIKKTPLILMQNESN